MTPEPTPTATPVPAHEPVLNVNIAKDKIGIGQQFVTEISLENVKDIYAEDFEIKYDVAHLEYLGFEEVTGYKVYNSPTDLNGVLRFIIASQGEEYGINEDTVILKLKFKAKAIGTAVVDSTKARIADSEQEYVLKQENCLEDSILIEATDVNKSGQYTLLDLAIDAKYFKYLAANVDPVKYNAQQAGDEYVNDDDLLFIVEQMLSNPDYLPIM
ncbi:cohesin domain-containing protein [Paenibacillus typhae]|uniref:cohesin domain-containing protein n=1 Tax=Paenibacillus typhae TaxID=1174501 RepID=UPI001ABF19CC|nr:cohesin domain-containing protein [Paenibacillus typhae]